MSILRHFTEFNLTKEEIVNAGILFSTVILILCLVSKLIVREEKKLAWVITLFNSGLLSLVGISYAIIKLPYHWPAFTFQPGHREIFHSIDNISALMCLWFALANAADLLYGFLFYRKYVQLLSGWAHHVVFIWIMYMCTTGDGIFLTIQPFAATFAMSSLEEIPTFLLALGALNPQLRTDLGFGITFFIFRIVYHFYLMYAGWISGYDITLRVLHALTFALHVSWFNSWRKNYAKYRKQQLEKEFETNFRKEK